VDAGRADGPRFTGPGLLPDAIVVDHGRVYVSAHVTSACARLGISIQPARPYTPTDKAPVERFFRTLGQGLLEALPGYKGPDVFSRGKDVEDDAFFYLGELEDIIREWVAVVYHRSPHSSLADPRLPGLKMSPLQRFGHGVARAGRIEVPRDGHLALDLLPVRWRTIQHYGVEIDGLRYSGPIVAKYKDRTSGYKQHGNYYGARKGGKWPFSVNPDDLSRIYFRDPDDQHWHALEWEHAAELGAPLSADALAYAKELARRRDELPDAGRAVRELLEAWNVGLAGNRTERRIALRMAAERAALQPSVPGAGNDPCPGPGSADGTLPSAQDSTAGDDNAGTCTAGGLDDFYADALEVLE
jgi:Mu transposase, C-terminal